MKGDKDLSDDADEKSAKQNKTSLKKDNLNLTEGVEEKKEEGEKENPKVEEKSYDENGVYTFNIGDLELDPLTATENGGTDVIINEDGSATLNFKGQYAQAYFKLPAGINPKRVASIEFKGAKADNFSVKVQPKPGDDSLEKAGGVTYGNTKLNISGLDFAYFAAMVECLRRLLKL